MSSCELLFDSSFNQFVSMSFPMTWNNECLKGLINKIINPSVDIRLSQYCSTIVVDSLLQTRHKSLHYQFANIKIERKKIEIFFRQSNASMTLHSLDDWIWISSMCGEIILCPLFDTQHSICDHVRISHKEQLFGCVSNNLNACSLHRSDCQAQLWSISLTQFGLRKFIDRYQWSSQSFSHLVSQPIRSMDKVLMIKAK